MRLHGLPNAAAARSGTIRVEAIMPSCTPRFPVLAVLVAGACGVSDTPLAPADVEGAPELSVASDCHAVQFNVSGPLTVIRPGVVEVPVQGDISGIVRFTFDLSSPRFEGATAHNRGVADWTVSGIPGLTSFATEFENHAIWMDRPGSSGNVFENTGRHRAIGGVTKANLHYSGTSGVNGPNWDHSGVICL